MVKEVVGRKQANKIVNFIILRRCVNEACLHEGNGCRFCILPPRPLQVIECSRSRVVNSMHARVRQDMYLYMNLLFTHVTMALCDAIPTPYWYLLSYGIKSSVLPCSCSCCVCASILQGVMAGISIAAYTSILLLFAYSFAWLVVLRFIAGIGLGAFSLRWVIYSTSKLKNEFLFVIFSCLTHRLVQRLYLLLKIHVFVATFNWLKCSSGMFEA